MIVATPVTKTAATTKVCPRPGIPALPESGGYIVQPDPAEPMSAKNETAINSCEITNTQNDNALSSGNAMSRAPIISGMQKFPNAPIMIGVIAKKIMIKPCMVKIVLYAAGVTMPPDFDNNNDPSTGTGSPG